MRNYKSYTDEEISFMVVSRTLKKTWETISEEMKQKFGHARTPNNLSTKYNKIIGIDFSNYYTDEQRIFVYSAWLNNFNSKKIIKGFEEQFKQTINEDGIDFIVKQMAHENKVDEELTKTKNKIKQKMEMKEMKKGTWTKEEDEQLLACITWKKAMELDNGRSKAAKNNRWSILQKKQQSKGAKRGRMTMAELAMIRNCKTLEEALALNLRKPKTITTHWEAFQVPKQGEAFDTITEQMKLTPDERKKKAIKWEKEQATKWEKSHGNKGKKYAPRWTKEEDYDLILNFYELSIDDARNRFNRSYGAIATRLEKLVDSTKPEHISMLMEASKEIKSRKGEQNPTPKKGRRTLRREQKQAKKAAKLEAKLDRLRGV